MCAQPLFDTSQPDTTTETFSNRLQGDHERIDGLVEPRPLPALQHKATANLGNWDSETPDAFLTHHSRLRVASYCSCSYRSPGNYHKRTPIFTLANLHTFVVCHLASSIIFR